MEAMPDPRYCAPCRRLLSGTVQFHDGKHFIHHHDANSLTKSLELPCSICSLAYRHIFQHRPAVDGTRGFFFDLDNSRALFLSRTSNSSHPDDSSAKVLRLRWDSPNAGGSDIIFVPWKNMLEYSLPDPLSPRTDSSTALDFLLRRYRDCKDTHVACRSHSPNGAFPPLRVIDVGESTSSRVHLRSTQGFTDASYICLSYCWGNTQPLLLTKQTEAMLYNGVSVSTLSKTFQDAVYVTRLLGIRYLWIDSLCIFQDNEADWAHEASRMRLIYSHATCTLAATSAENSAGGFFFDRNPDALQPLRVEFSDTPDSNVRRRDLDHPLPALYWCDRKDMWTSDVESAPLAHRAWVCQERHLSSRIIHFTKCGLFWECHEYKASENYPNGIPEWAEPYWDDDQTVLKREIHRMETQLISSSPGSTSSSKTSPKKHIDAASVRDIYFAWCKFRIAYSRCNLTREVDKLVAIQGIADHMSTVVGDRLIAGLWRNQLLQDLCWSRHDEGAIPLELTNWRAPTWSWASTNGTIWVSLTYRDHGNCPNWRLLSEIDSVDVKSRPSGELEHATLRIRCRPISAIITPDKASPLRFEVYGTLTFTNSKVQMHAALKGNPELAILIDEPSWEEPRSVLLVVLQECRHGASLDGLDTKIPEDQSDGFEEDQSDGFEEDQSDGFEEDQSDGFEEDQSDEFEEDNSESSVEGLLVVLQCGHQDVYQRVGLFKISGVDDIAKISREHEAAEDAIITLT